MHDITHVPKTQKGLGDPVQSEKKYYGNGRCEYSVCLLDQS